MIEESGAASDLLSLFQVPGNRKGSASQRSLSCCWIALLLFLQFGVQPHLFVHLFYLDDALLQFGVTVPGGVVGHVVECRLIGFHAEVHEHLVQHLLNGGAYLVEGEQVGIRPGELVGFLLDDTVAVQVGDDVDPLGQQFVCRLDHKIGVVQVLLGK